MTTKSWLQLSVALLVAAVIGTLIYFGYREKRQNEPVWLENPKIWTYVPLKVRWESSELMEHEDSLTQAMKRWNTAVGCDLFTAADDNWDVQVIHSGALEPTQRGQAWILANGKGEIRVNKLADVTCSVVVFGNELGHILGLAHDGKGTMAAPYVSVMVQNVADFCGLMRNDLPDVLVTDKDKAALHERYCNR